MNSIVKFSLICGATCLCCKGKAKGASLYTSEHGDVFAVAYENGSIEPHIHIEGGIVDGVLIADAEYAPADITTVVPQSTFSYIQSVGGRPAAAAWAAIGVGSGEGFYYIPQSDSGAGGAAALNAPFAGIGTEDLTASEWSGNISFSLLSVSGPGHFSLWQDGFAGPTFYMSTANGISAADVFQLNAGGHDHSNFGFSAPGFYEIELEVSGTHATDGFKSTNATFTFQVVPEPSGAALGLLGAAVLVFRRRR